jgi:hypothetical protein
MRQNPGSRGLLILAAARPALSHGRLGGSGATCERRREVPAATAMPTPGLPIPTFSPESPTTMMSPMGRALGEFPGRVPGRTLGGAQALRRGEPAHERAVEIADPEAAADLWIGFAAFVL